MHACVRYIYIYIINLFLKYFAFGRIEHYTIQSDLLTLLSTNPPHYLLKPVDAVLFGV